MKCSGCMVRVKPKGVGWRAEGRMVAGVGRAVVVCKSTLQTQYRMTLGQSDGYIGRGCAGKCFQDSQW